MPPFHWFLALAAVFVWGTNFVVITWGLAHFPPFLFAVLRFVLTAFPLMLVVRRPQVAWRHIAGFGVLTGAGQFGLLYFAMNRYITPGLASLLMQSQVIFTIVISVTLRGMRIRPLQLCAVALATLGIALVAWGSAAVAGAHVTVLGVAMVLGAGLCWACANFLIQSLGRVPVIPFLIWSSAFAAVPLMILCLVFEHAEHPVSLVLHATPGAWAAVLWQACGNTLFGFGIWNWLLARHAASTVTPSALLVPVFGMSASAWMLGEALPAWKLGAASLVLIGLALNAFASRTIMAERV